MSIATYRGIKYDTQIPKEESEAWIDLVQMKNHDQFTYRGLKYNWKRTKNVF